MTVILWPPQTTPENEHILTTDVAKALMETQNRNYVDVLAYATSLAASAGTGLHLIVNPGVAWIEGIRVENDAASDLTMTNATTNYVYLVYDGLFTVNTSGVAPSHSVPIAQVTTAGGVITLVTDVRPFRYSIVNADVNAAAAIAYSKLALTGAVKSADISAESWTVYTPVWTASTTDPVIGTGSLYGRWMRYGKLVFCTIRCLPNATTTFGSGFYRWSLPVAAYSSRYQGNVTGYDSGTAYLMGTAIIPAQGGSYSQLSVMSSVPTDYWAHNIPMTWAANDEMYAAIAYEAAT